MHACSRRLATRPPVHLSPFEAYHRQRVEQALKNPEDPLNEAWRGMAKAHEMARTWLLEKLGLTPLCRLSGSWITRRFSLITPDWSTTPLLPVGLFPLSPAPNATTTFSACLRASHSSWIACDLAERMKRISTDETYLSFRALIRYSPLTLEDYLHFYTKRVLYHDDFEVVEASVAADIVSVVLSRPDEPAITLSDVLSFIKQNKPTWDAKKAKRDETERQEEEDRRMLEEEGGKDDEEKGSVSSPTRP
ncbi:hypothetical protein JCM8097_003602 [Rhodosporidiobolus ruineniae]